MSIYIGDVIKNKIMSRNFVLILEIRSLKLFLKMNLENYSQIFQNFSDFLPKNFNIEELNYELRRNWNVYEKTSKIYHVSSCTSEKLTSLLLAENFA